MNDPCRRTNANPYALIALFGALSLILAPSVSQAQEGMFAPWTWNRDVSAGESLLIDLIRARVEIRAGSAERIEVRVAGSVSQGANPAMQSFFHDGAWTLIDRYPPRSPFLAPEECLPAVGPHGDFWSSDVVLDVFVAVPESMAVQVKVLEGKVHDYR